ncbi:MAG: beta-lactamase regulating signal transducer with metallopeptidase domain [Cognaticolwellia sp.]|jgi:beta-lactamase regulating signal transducer with metallopeptidase domain
MSGPAELSIVTGVILDAGLKATAVLGVAWGLSTLLRHRSAAARHAVWATSLTCLLVLPLVAAQRGPSIAIDAPWVVGIWAVGALIALSPLLFGLFKLHWIKRGAQRNGQGLLFSEALNTPVTWGLFRPVVLLPESARAWDPGLVQAALAHEQAHIQRRDWAVHILAWTISALFWFNPVVWLARHKLAQDAEHAADDAVLSQGVRATDYASLLLSLARCNPPRVALGIGHSQIALRVRAILEPRARSARRWPVWVAALLLATLALPALGAWPTWSAPQDTLTCK